MGERLEQSARVHTPPHHTAYQLIDGVINDQFVSFELFEKLFRHGFNHVSRNDIYWLTYRVIESNEENTKLAVSFPDNAFQKDRKYRSAQIFQLATFLMGPVTKEDCRARELRHGVYFLGSKITWF